MPLILQQPPTSFSILPSNRQPPSPPRSRLSIPPLYTTASTKHIISSEQPPETTHTFHRNSTSTTITAFLPFPPSTPQLRSNLHITPTTIAPSPTQTSPLQLLPLTSAVRQHQRSSRPKISLDPPPSLLLPPTRSISPSLPPLSPNSSQTVVSFSSLPPSINQIRHSPQQPNLHPLSQLHPLLSSPATFSTIHSPPHRSNPPISVSLLPNNTHPPATVLHSSAVHPSNSPTSPPHFIFFPIPPNHCNSNIPLLPNFPISA